MEVAMFPVIYRDETVGHATSELGAVRVIARHHPLLAVSVFTGKPTNQSLMQSMGAGERRFWLTGARLGTNVAGDAAWYPRYAA